MTAGEPVAQFPLGSVLLPSMLLPLHIFEPRYRQLIADVESPDSDLDTFGVVLIERGTEVGGGDVRRDHGTLVRMLEVQWLPDGRAMVLAAGTERFRVLDWLSDSPYPMANIELVPDDEDEQPLDSGATSGLLERFMDCRGLLERHGVDAGAVPPLADDPGLMAYQIAQASPIGDHDRYRLLVERSPARRVALLDQMLVDAQAVLEFRLGDS